MMLPPYKGSTFRGGLLAAFKREVCLRSNDKSKRYDKKCKSCSVNEHCSYYSLFESYHFASSLGVSMSYIVEPPLMERRMFDAGDALSFSVVLIGQSTTYWNLLIFAVKRLGETSGLGRRIDGQRGKFLLKRVDSLGLSGSSVTVYSAEHGFNHDKPLTLREEDMTQINDINPSTKQNAINDIQYILRFLTHIRFIINVEKIRKKRPCVLNHIRFENGRKKKRLVTNFDFVFLIQELLRRLGGLSEAYCEGYYPDFSHLLECASDVRTKKSLLSRKEIKRYSARQNRRHPIGGMIGFLQLEGNLEPFLPYLRLGEWLHIGKKTTFGLGQYKIMEV